MTDQMYNKTHLLSAMCIEVLHMFLLHSFTQQLLHTTENTDIIPGETKCLRPCDFQGNWKLRFQPEHKEPRLYAERKVTRGFDAQGPRSQ